MTFDAKESKERIEESEMQSKTQKKKVANEKKTFYQLAVSPKKRQI